MTKERAKQMWDEWKWWLAAIVLPLTLWAFKAYDASKIGRVEFEQQKIEYERQRFELRTRYIADSTHHARDDQTLQYLACRQDFTRRECLRPDR